MNPYMPYAALPTAVFAAWLAVPHLSASEPGRYQVPGVQRIEDPTVQIVERVADDKPPVIRVAAFLPDEPPKTRAPETVLALQSVVIGDRVNLATINGRSLHTGQQIEGYVVQRITANGVDLARNGRVRHLPMRPLHELPRPAQPAAGYR